MPVDIASFAIIYELSGSLMRIGNTASARLEYDSEEGVSCFLKLHTLATLTPPWRTHVDANT